jgi:hypothetical protein
MDEDTRNRRRLVAEALTLAAAASTDWDPWANLALFNAACLREDLTSDDLWMYLMGRHNPPAEPKRMASVMTSGARLGWIVRTQNFHTSRVPMTHRHGGRAQRVWKSLIFGTAPAAWPEP